jgi:pimeloyl-ACP methyl ester carboxylesterase
VLEFKDLLQVVLVGHSYGGMVITGVADQAPQRLTQLVYLDAEVPLDGQCEFDLLPTDERADYQQAATTKGQGWQIPPPVPEPLPQELDAKLRWAMSLMVPQPINTVTQPLHLANPLGAGVRPTYVLCTQGKEGQELPGYVHRAWSDPALRVDRSWHLGRLSRFRRSRCGSRPVPPPRRSPCGPGIPRPASCWTATAT